MKKKIAVIGGGAAALSFASFVDTFKYDVTIYERNKALGRKFLVAGKGGFNLTHAESIEQMIGKYTPSGFLNDCLIQFSNEDFRNWLGKIGISTYVGSSNRVFPTKGIKPIEVLKAIENHMLDRNIKLIFGHKWDGEQIADIMVFAMGGGSWSVTGSDGEWTSHFANVVPFQAANCSFLIDWPSDLASYIEGKPLKNIVIGIKGQHQKGEIVMTKTGIEGGAIYALSEVIQQNLTEKGVAQINIDLKKDLSKVALIKKILGSSEKNTSTLLKRDIKLSKAAIQLLKAYISKDDFLNPDQLAKNIKNLPLNITGPAPIDEAISTMGGISVNDLTHRFELKNRPNSYCIGEMVDWNAPTGGYLLQACFSMGHYLATNLNALHP